jgi:hypothetical protein
VDFYQTTRRHIPGDCQLYENLGVMLSDMYVWLKIGLVPVCDEHGTESTDVQGAPRQGI